MPSRNSLFDPDLLPALTFLLNEHNGDNLSYVLPSGQRVTPTHLEIRGNPEDGSIYLQMRDDRECTRTLWFTYTCSVRDFLSQNNYLLRYVQQKVDRRIFSVQGDFSTACEELGRYIL